MQTDIQTHRISGFKALLHCNYHMLFLVLLVKCCHWKRPLYVTTLCITVMWFGFLCAAKDQKAPLFLGQMLLQVSATKHGVASLSINVPGKSEDCYPVILYFSCERPSLCRVSLSLLCTIWDCNYPCLSAIFQCYVFLHWHKSSLSVDGRYG